jgi:hypothetical protein
MRSGSAPWRQSLRSHAQELAARRPRTEHAYWASSAGASACGVLRIDRSGDPEETTLARFVVWGLPSLAEADALASLANLATAKQQQQQHWTFYLAVRRPPFRFQFPSKRRALVVPDNLAVGTDIVALGELQRLFEAAFTVPVETARAEVEEPLLAAFRPIVDAHYAAVTMPLRKRRTMVRHTVAAALLPNGPSEADVPAALWATLRPIAERMPEYSRYKEAAKLLAEFGPAYVHFLQHVRTLAETLPLTMVRHGAAQVLAYEGCPPSLHEENVAATTACAGAADDDIDEDQDPDSTGEGGGGEEEEEGESHY